jgi:hypothetical protein
VVGPTNGTGDYVGAGGVQFAEYRAECVADAIAAVLDQLAAEPERVRSEARLAAQSHFAVTDIVDQLEMIFAQALRAHTTRVPDAAPHRLN